MAKVLGLKVSADFAIGGTTGDGVVHAIMLKTIDTSKLMRMNFDMERDQLCGY
jgi:hypothetical protein